MPPSTHLALLRGINVGGRNKLPMKGLIPLFEGLDCTDVRTFIQSGNVLYRAPRGRAGEVGALVSRAIHGEFGLEVPVVVRSIAQLRNALENNPFLAEGADTEHLHLGFFARKPARTKVAALDSERSPGDRYAIQGAEVYFHCPGGLARTKLTSAFFDKGLGTIVTVRNWKTASRLLELAQA